MGRGLSIESLKKRCFVIMLMRRLRNLTLVCINWPVVKLVSLHVVLFKIPIDDIEDLLYCNP